jgi:hypothetical protein
MNDEQGTPLPADQSQASEQVDDSQTSSTEGSQQPQAQGQPQYVTKEQLAAAVELGVQRAQQSARDRTHKIEQNVKTIEANLAKIGVTVTPEMTEKIREQTVANLETQEATPPAADSSSSVASDEIAEGHPVFDWTKALYADEGLAITPADPEFAKVKLALEDPNGSFVKYQKVVVRAIDQKRDRLASSDESADARILGDAHQSTALGQDINPHDLFQAAHRK